MTSIRRKKKDFEKAIDWQNRIRSEKAHLAFFEKKLAWSDATKIPHKYCAGGCGKYVDFNRSAAQVKNNPLGDTDINILIDGWCWHCLRNLGNSM